MTEQITSKIKVKEIIDSIKREISKVIIGQETIVEEILIALFSGGHVLLEGVPGTAKTLMVRVLSLIVQSDFCRIQFTPDLLPSDILGTHVFDIKSSDFYLKKGPIFTNLLLADEINRAPPKAQAALLEAMEEHQVTIEGETLPLPEPFMVFATQNPIEYEGTFPLPEAQLDRFMLKIIVSYLTTKEEEKVLQMYHQGFKVLELHKQGIKAIANAQVIKECQKVISEVTVSEQMFRYITEIVSRSRSDINLNLGASPRASIAILLCSKTRACFEGRDYILPDDVKRVAFPVMRHRIILRPEAEIEGMTPDDVIRNILGSVEVPR